MTSRSGCTRRRATATSASSATAWSAATQGWSGPAATGPPATRRSTSTRSSDPVRWRCVMVEIGKRHPRDAVSLVFGLLLAAVAGLFLLTDLTDVSLDVRWVAPAVLVGVGVLGLLASTRPRRK